MKKIEPPIFDDITELEILSENKKLGSYPELKTKIEIIEQQYQLYHDHNGDPWVINHCGLSNALKGSMKTHYSSPPKNRLFFMEDYRKNLSPDFCPMCGGFGLGTLDHYLPKDDYAEFSFFSRNLIPACSCNSKRGTTVKGDAIPKRVIHPYFDEFLGERLYKAVFDGDYESPLISVDVVDALHPKRDILEFHLEEVLLKNNIIGWLEKTWSNLRRRPYDKLKLVLPDADDDIDAEILRVCIEKYLAAKDEEYETPNNWWSIFYFGLLGDIARLRSLVREINSIRAG